MVLLFLYLILPKASPLRFSWELQNTDEPRQLLNTQLLHRVKQESAATDLWKHITGKLLAPGCIPGPQSKVLNCCPRWRDIWHQQKSWLLGAANELPEGGKPWREAPLPAFGAWRDPPGPHPFIVLSLLIWHQSWARRYHFLAILRDFDTCYNYLSGHLQGAQMLCLCTLFRQFRPFPRTGPDLVKIEGNFHERQWGCILVKLGLVLTFILSWGNCQW